MFINIKSLLFPHGRRAENIVESRGVDRQGVLKSEDADSNLSADF